MLNIFHMMHTKVEDILFDAEVHFNEKEVILYSVNPLFLS